MYHSSEELRVMIKKMKEASSAFYMMATSIGNHPFIEFAGFMNEYIRICEEALAQGIDFTQAHAHSGQALPMASYHAAYIGEKFGCIFGPSLQDEELWKSFEESVRE